MNKPFIAKEDNLPFPYVHYPSCTGPFIGFSQYENSEIYFCSCFQKTLKNYLINKKNSNITYTCDAKNYILSSTVFPYDFTMKLIQNKIVSKAENVIHSIHFKDNLCHQCNCISPKYRVNYCNMSSFELQHAWYIQKLKYDLGLYNNKYSEYLPDEYLNILLECWELDDKGQTLAKSGKLAEASKYYNASARKYTIFHRWLENQVRAAFNYPLIGEHWKEETTLYKIVQSLFPNTHIERHYRPDWLERLELDIFIPQMSLGIEYHGIQHYQPIEHWGGIEGLIKRQEHDMRKSQLAKINNVSIAYFTYKDNLTSELVFDRIKPFIS